jgi:hypothetical protein
MLISGTSRFILSDTSTNLIPYQTSIALQQENLNASTMNITEFTSGPYTGHYMLINSGVNDSIITKLSKPISTVFIWRWNKSEDMVVFSNQMKSLSGYAQSIIKQAQDLKNIIIELRKLGNHAGLIHCLEDQSEPMYMSKTLNDHNDSLIFDYLNSFTESNLYDKYVNRSSGSVPTWVPSGGSNSLLEQSRNDFLSTIKNAKTLLMNGTGSQYQHIILISAGFPKNNITKNYYREVTDVLNSVTVASENASWYGVDLQNTFSQKGLYQWRGYLFPTFSPVLIQLRINNALQPLSYPLSQNTWGQPFSLSARETALWDSAFVWTGFDGAGVPTVSIEEKPMVYIIHADSGIAKLWADDENHIAEKEDVYPGGTFGILTKATFFQATVDNISDIDQSSIPFLNDDEIHTPRTKTIKKANADIKSTLKIVKGVLNIETEKDFSILKITDLTGKVILSIDLNRYKTGIHTYSIPLSAILQKYGKKKLLGILIGKTTQVLTIDIGGLR